MKEMIQTPEAAMKHMQKIFKKRGTKALGIARKEMLQEKTESEEAKKAIAYFMTQYWHDLARPSLLSMVCEAVGGDSETTTPVAVPMILISGALSIHDDIIDRTRTKGGYDTVYGRFGKDIALLVGDALLFKGFSLVSTLAGKGVPTSKVSIIAEIIKDTFFELGTAEAMELNFRRRLDVLPEAYLQIIEKKAADVEAHARIGVVLGNGSKEEVEAMAHYGRILGMMIILRDDWIDLMDFEESRHRIEKESLPIPILYGLQDRKTSVKLRPILTRREVRKKDAQALLEVINTSKAMKRYLALMNELAANASSKLKSMKKNETKDLELLLRATLPPSLDRLNAKEKNQFILGGSTRSLPEP